MAPHGIYPASGDDDWVAIACRHDDDWAAMADVIGRAWASDSAYTTLAGRVADQDRLDEQIAAWTVERERTETEAALRAVDAWAAASGTDAGAGGEVAAALDALLGVDVR